MLQLSALWAVVKSAAGGGAGFSLALHADNVPGVLLTYYSSFLSLSPSCQLSLLPLPLSLSPSCTGKWHQAGPLTRGREQRVQASRQALEQLRWLLLAGCPDLFATLLMQYSRSPHTPVIAPANLFFRGHTP